MALTHNEVLAGIREIVEEVAGVSLIKSKWIRVLPMISMSIH